MPLTGETSVDKCHKCHRRARWVSVAACYCRGELVETRRADGDAKKAAGTGPAACSAKAADRPQKLIMLPIVKPWLWKLLFALELTALFRKLKLPWYWSSYRYSANTCKPGATVYRAPAVIPRPRRCVTPVNRTSPWYQPISPTTPTVSGPVTYFNPTV